MTDREKAIVMAYVRAYKLEGDELLEFQRYVEDIVGGPVSMDKIKIIADENKKILEDTIMTLCSKNDNSEPKWIPVTERLPEEECGCLVTTCRRHNYFKNVEIVTCYYYPDMRSKWFPDDGSDAENVIAWMPLPEPYKESEE